MNPTAAPPFKIIPGCERHVGEIREIWKRFIDYHTPLDPLFTRRPDGHEAFIAFVRQMMMEDTSAVFVALEDGAVAGYTMARVETLPPVLLRDRIGLIYDMAVREQSRRSGAGSLLLAAAEAWLHEKKMDRIELKVVPHNPAGYSFWRKHGYAPYLHVMKKVIP